MCAFQCDSCFHKMVCTDEPNTRALNEECALYANVKNFTGVQQLKAEIASYADRLFELSRGGGELMPVMGVVNKLRQLSAV